MCISGLVVEYIVAIDVTRVRLPADALSHTAAKCDHHRWGALCRGNACRHFMDIITMW